MPKHGVRLNNKKHQNKIKNKKIYELFQGSHWDAVFIILNMPQVATKATPLSAADTVGKCPSPHLAVLLGNKIAENTNPPFQESLISRILT